MPRWLPALIAALLGLAMGLGYGWLVDPVEFIDTTPDTLRADYRADYVLMVAEAYQTEQDPDLAARRLAVWSSQPPAEIAAEGIELARQFSFSQADISLMQKLETALLGWQPASESGTAP
jgi:hypothetical protein